jgi:hypothetical protein
LEFKTFVTQRRKAAKNAKKNPLFNKSLKRVMGRSARYRAAGLINPK